MRARSWLCGVALAAAGCAQVLDIPVREEDPSLNQSAASLPDCAGFCRQVSSVCKGEDLAYPGDAACEQACLRWPAGDLSNPTDLNSNTRACRHDFLQRSAAAGISIRQTCAVMGMGGMQETEGSPCNSLGESPQDFFCDEMEKVCPKTFDSRAQCKGAVVGIPLLSPAGFTAGDANSLQCRFYHMSAALLNDYHCDHSKGLLHCCELEDPKTGKCKEQQAQ